MNLFPPWWITQQRRRQQRRGGSKGRRHCGPGEVTKTRCQVPPKRPFKQTRCTWPVRRAAACCYLPRIRPNLRVTERQRTDLTVKQQAFDSLLYGRPLHACRGFFPPSVAGGVIPFAARTPKSARSKAARGF